VKKFRLLQSPGFYRSVMYICVCYLLAESQMYKIPSRDPIKSILIANDKILAINDGRGGICVGRKVRQVFYLLCTASQCINNTNVS
jgi:hypothetical protein